MKVSRILCLCAAAALPHLALAGDSTNPAGLGIVDAVLDFCTHVDPHSAASFDALKVSVAHGDTALTTTAEYAKAYKLTSEALAKIPKGDALKYCVAGASSYAPPPVHPPKAPEPKKPHA
jgi:threonine synthase